MGLTCDDMMRDGMLDLVVLTLKGLHILQVRKLGVLPFRYKWGKVTREKKYKFFLVLFEFCSYLGLSEIVTNL